MAKNIDITSLLWKKHRHRIAIKNWPSFKSRNNITHDWWFWHHFWFKWFFLLVDKRGLQNSYLFSSVRMAACWELVCIRGTSGWNWVICCTLHTAHCTPPASSRQRRYLHQVFYFRGFTSKLERPRSSKLIYHQKRGVDFLADTLLLIRVGRDIRKLCGGLCPLFLLSQNLTAQSEIVIVQLKKSSYLRCLSNLPLNFPCEKHCKFLD